MFGTYPLYISIEGTLFIESGILKLITTLIKKSLNAAHL
jgi:hypothetical protein